MVLCLRQLKLCEIPLIISVGNVPPGRRTPRCPYVFEVWWVFCSNRTFSPLGPLPWSLAAPADGSLKKTAKSSLAKELQKDSPAVENLPSQLACIIDGMAMVQRRKGGQKTFREVADMLLAMVLREGASSARIDAVFDVYRKISVKNAEREKRGAAKGNEYRSIRPDHRVQQWRRFLSNPENKQQLVHSIVNEWRKERCSVKLAGKRLYATAGEECYEISSDGSVLCAELRSTQEEADTRLLYTYIT